MYWNLRFKGSTVVGQCNKAVEEVQVDSEQSGSCLDLAFAKVGQPTTVHLRDSGRLMINQAESLGASG
jgi:hypothetical protein